MYIDIYIQYINLKMEEDEAIYSSLIFFRLKDNEYILCSAYEKNLIVQIICNHRTLLNTQQPQQIRVS